MENIKGKRTRDKGKGKGKGKESSWVSKENTQVIDMVKKEFFFKKIKRKEKWSDLFVIKLQLMKSI